MWSAVQWDGFTHPNFRQHHRLRAIWPCQSYQSGARHGSAIPGQVRLQKVLPKHSPAEFPSPGHYKIASPLHKYNPTCRSDMPAELRPKHTGDWKLIFTSNFDLEATARSENGETNTYYGSINSASQILQPVLSHKSGGNKSTLPSQNHWKQNIPKNNPKS